MHPLIWSYVFCINFILNSNTMMSGIESDEELFLFAGEGICGMSYMY